MTDTVPHQKNDKMSDEESPNGLLKRNKKKDSDIEEPADAIDED